MTSRVEINSDPAEVIARAGQCQTLASSYREMIAPRMNELTGRLVMDLATFGEDKFGRTFKANMQPGEVIKAMRMTAEARADDLEDIGGRVMGAVAALAQTDLKYDKEIRSIAPDAK